MRYHRNLTLIYVNELMVNWFCYTLFHFKLQNLLIMLSEVLLYFIKFSIKVSVKGMESDWARSPCLAHSSCKSALDKVLWVALMTQDLPPAFKELHQTELGEKMDMLMEFRVGKVIPCPQVVLSTVRLERLGEWGFHRPQIPEHREWNEDRARRSS